MDAQNRDKITNELMIYHMKVCINLYNNIYRYVVMCIPGYHHDGFMPAPELGHMMYC